MASENPFKLRSIFALPSKDTPAIVLAVANFVAVAALPSIEPDIVLLKVLVPAIV